MRTVLIGARGQLGTDLAQVLRGDVVPLGHNEIELTEIESVRAALQAARPDVVVNTAAYNLVDRAEDEPQAAFAVNALGTRNVALVCRELEASLLHVSSDYVFGLDSGRAAPYKEFDLPGPVSAYGLSKLTGEYFARSICPRHYVVRTCGLYGTAGSRGKGNFVETMLRLGSQRHELSVVNDQFCTPTATSELARAIADLIPTERFGLYHATNGGQTTWCDLAREIFRLSGLDVKVLPISSATFGAKARRPPYSVLDCSLLAETIGWELPDWTGALAGYLAQRQAS